MDVLDSISEQLQKGRAKAVKELVQQAIDERVPAQDVLEKGLFAGMSAIGRKFKHDEVFIPEVLLAVRAMKVGIALLAPLLAEAGVQSSGKACIGTVRDDLHDIGKSLVKIMLESKGIEVVDLGTDVSPEQFIATAKEQGCQLICCSALLTTTQCAMQEVVELAEKEGLREKVKIMVGGAPVTQAFCDLIGADCYTPNATTASEAAAGLCRQLLRPVPPRQ